MHLFTKGQCAGGQDRALESVCTRPAWTSTCFRVTAPGKLRQQGQTHQQHCQAGKNQDLFHELVRQTMNAQMPNISAQGNTAIMVDFTIEAPVQRA